MSNRITSLPLSRFDHHVKKGRCRNFDICGNKIKKPRRYYCSGKCASDLCDKSNWPAVREIVLRRDNYKCVKCGAGPECIDAEKSRIETRLDDIHKRIMNLINSGLRPSYDDPLEKERRKLEQKLDYIENHAIEVDHIVPVALGGDPLDPDNCQTLCYCHHQIKTKQDKRKIHEKKKQELEKRIQEERLRRKKQWRSWGGINRCQG